MKALPNLDFVRAIAVISVVVEHVLLAYKILWIGHCEIQWIGVVGVFIFFVHTSLVLMWSLERRPHTLDFYIRRIFRIYPLAISVMVLTFLFRAPVGGTPQMYFHFAPPKTGIDLISAYLLIPNLVHGYLPDSVMWSLPYEMQMYIALPLLFFFVRKNFNQWPLLFYWVFIVILGLSLFRHVPHNLILCVPYFLPGIMAYVAFGRRKATLPSWLLPIGLSITWAIFMIRPSWRSADIVCLAVGFGLPSFRQITIPWVIRASHEIAKYSYSIYLMHPFSIVLGLYLMPHSPLALQLGVILGSLLVLSFCGYHLIEKPMISLGARLAGKAERRFEQYDVTIRKHPPEQRPSFEPLPTAESQ